MVLVGTRLGSNVHDATGVTAKLGTVAGGLDAEFRNYIGAGNENGQIANPGIRGNTIEVRCTLVGDTATDLVIAGSKHVLARQRVAFRTALRHDAGNESDQVQQIPATYGKFLHRAGVHRLAEVGIFGLKEGSGCGYFHGLGHVTELHHNVGADSTGDRYFHRRHCCPLEPGEFHFHAIGGRHQV